MRFRSELSAILVAIVLLLVSCSKPGEVVHDVRIKALSAPVQETRIYRLRSDIAFKLSADEQPRAAGDEGCMCTYWNAPRHLVDSIIRRFNGLVFTAESVEKAIEDAKRNGNPPTVVVFDLKNDGQLHVSVVSSSGQILGTYEAKVEANLVVDPTPFGRANREKFGSSPGFWGLVKGLFSEMFEPSEEKSPLFMGVFDFLSAKRS